MSFKTIIAVLLLSVTLSPAPVLAQKPSSVPPMVTTQPLTAADLDDLRAELRASRKEFVAQNLSLTPDEATRFWPIYDQYISELIKINDTRYQMLADYANTYGKYDDEAAMSFITRWLGLDVQTAALRARYVPLVAKVLPGIKTATFFQIDRRTAMAIDLKVASMLPILQGQIRK
jgi:hypothetical protein